MPALAHIAPGLESKPAQRRPSFQEKKDPARGAEIEIGGLRSGHEASFIEFDKDQAVDVCSNTETILTK
jgi:hypothetical protein